MIRCNGLLIGFLALYGLQLLFYLGLEYLNLKHRREKGASVPGAFQGFIDQEKLNQSTAYFQANTRFGIGQGLFSEFLLLVLLLSGFLPFLDGLTSSWGLSLIPAGLFFFVVPGGISWLLELPFDYYQTFIIEERFGFNQSSGRVWLADQIKSGLLSLVLLILVLSLLLGIIRLSPGYWWVWGFLSLSAFQLLLTILFPVLIAPLFNKFVPIQDEVLGEKIKQMMEKAAIPIKGIFQMDAGKRSRHTNAYFTGLGRTKRIVLYDTLIQNHPHQEILAVLAHEAGHFKKRHILKQFLLMETGLFFFFYLFSCILDWPLLYTTFGFQVPRVYAGLLLIGVMIQKAGFFLMPFPMALSRRFENEADAFAVMLMQSAESMITGLKRLAADNLSNLFPHPCYVLFHYSHPPLLERVESLQSLSGEGPLH